MDKIKCRKGYFTFFSVGLFVGVIIGVITISLFISYRVDNYIKEIQYLNSVIEEDDIKLEKLQEVIHKKRLLVKLVKVDLNFKDEEQRDDITKIALEKHIREKLNGIIGKEVDKIDGDLLCEIIDRRIMKLDGKEYQLKINRIMISQEVKLWVEVKII